MDCKNILRHAKVGERTRTRSLPPEKHDERDLSGVALCPSLLAFLALADLLSLFAVKVKELRGGNWRFVVSRRSGEQSRTVA